MSSLAARRSARRPALYAKLSQMTLPLRPLVQFDTGHTHPAFPRSMLQFLLLTDSQLESLASFYHQRTPSELHYCYPCPISWPRSGLTVEDKRRKFGKFIGLRGCETPKRVSNGKLGCPGNCKTSWDTPIDSPFFCYECAMRQVQLILNGTEPEQMTGGGNGANAGPTKTIIITTGLSFDARRRAQSRNNSRTRLVRDDKSRRPATYALRLKQMSTSTSAPSSTPAPTASPSPQVAASPAPSPMPKPITVEEIIERARRARLEADANDALTRRKVGHY
ncbi:hypothetical protein F503_02309 [Ophiostoma piceae UAMH 11346]|uniref:Uncharacterized protein n=1 Tax=Ophiostoma piceae (strain UAMH 11346) TaxID=1262450 RepID=S3CXI5_OPHP1|nr:hypothetical protein F503_02309 [Ophiostoma piceae UAMH 11346]